MMEPKRLRDRVTHLEKEMVEVRGLASRADHEASDVHVRLHAHVETLNALRKTQLEQGQEIKKNFADVRSEMREGFAEMRQGFAKTAIGQQLITQLLTDHISSCEQSGEVEP